LFAPAFHFASEFRCCVSAAASAGLRAVLGDVEDQIRGAPRFPRLLRRREISFRGFILRRFWQVNVQGRSMKFSIVDVTYIRERNVGLRRKIRGALAYPVFLLFASGLMVTFLTLYVVPRMSDLFRILALSFHGAQIVVGLSKWLSSNVIWFGPLFIGGTAILFLWSRTAAGRLKVDALILKIPLAGKLVIQLSVAQATRSLATLLAGGITLVRRSWEIAAESRNNPQLRRRSSEILPMIREVTSSPRAWSCRLVAAAGIDMVRNWRAIGQFCARCSSEIAVFYDAESEGSA